MIPARGARTACETAIKDGGYRISGWPLETFTLLSTVLHQLPSEPHLCLIGTGLAACVAHLISVGGMATTTNGISVEPVILGGNDWRAITINIDIA